MIRWPNSICSVYYCQQTDTLFWLSYQGRKWHYSISLEKQVYSNPFLSGGLCLVTNDGFLGISLSVRGKQLVRNSSHLTAGDLTKRNRKKNPIIAVFKIKHLLPWLK